MKFFFFFFFSPLNNTFPPSLYEAHLGAVLTRLRDTLETKGAKVDLFWVIYQYDPPTSFLNTPILVKTFDIKTFRLRPEAFCIHI